MKIVNRDFLLFQKVYLINILGLSLFLFLYYNNILINMLNVDNSFISHAILGVLFLGIVYSFIYSFRISKFLKYIKNNDSDSVFQYLYNDFKIDSNDPNFIESLKNILVSKFSHIKMLAWLCVVLGLMGTLIGFIITLLGVDTSMISDVKKLPEVISNITHGLGIALYTTILGSVSNTWLTLNNYYINSSIHEMLSLLLLKLKNRTVLND